MTGNNECLCQVQHWWHQTRKSTHVHPWIWLFYTSSGNHWMHHLVWLYNTFVFNRIFRPSKQAKKKLTLHNPINLNASYREIGHLSCYPIKLTIPKIHVNINTYVSIFFFNILVGSKSRVFLATLFWKMMDRMEDFPAPPRPINKT